jgi:outer membrane lipoprotein LolB
MAIPGSALRQGLCGCALALLLSACASAPPAPPRDASHWSGRLSLQVESDPPQGFHAGFELHGSAQAGGMELLSPLGSTLARASWSAESALLQRGDQVHAYPDLAALSAALTGTELPVAELFEWLQGRAVPARGWELELEPEQGRLRARRTEPAPAATLRLKIDPPQP